MSASLPPAETLWPQLIAAGARYARNGWMPATAGNLSARHAPLATPNGEASITITASGHDKGELTPGALLLSDRHGRALASPDGGTVGRPSAETSIHLAVYRARPEVGAVHHAHPPYATLLGRRQAAALDLADHSHWPGAIEFPGGLRGYELIKALGLWGEADVARVPLFRNWGQVPRIAEELETWLVTTPAALPTMIIVGHGVTTWGATMADATRAMEATEYLCRLRYLETVSG